MFLLSKLNRNAVSWMNFSAAGKFFLYLLFMFLTFTYFTLYGMMAVGLTPSQHLAAVISSAFYSLWNLLSGFLIPKPVSQLFFLAQQVALNSSGTTEPLWPLSDPASKQKTLKYHCIQLNVFWKHFLLVFISFFSFVNPYRC